MGGELATLLDRHAAKHSVPGAAIGVLREGVVTTACYGVADVTTGQPVTPETRFSPGSLTKSMVATVVARLAEAARVSLDDPVAAHVPELRDSGWASRATLRDLLANRSGVPLQAGLEFAFADRANGSGLELSRLAEDVAAAESAGEFWSYSNAGWSLLGRVIETATNAPFEEAMRRHLFDPAGMDATTFLTEGGFANRASGHTVTADGPVPVAPMISPAYGPAGVGTLTTVTDMLRFAALHLEDPSLAPLRAVHAEVAITGWLDAWCLGWARFDWDGASVWGWDGLISGERSVLRIVPDQRAAVVLMTNSSNGRPMYRSLFTELMPASFGIGGPPLRLEAASPVNDLSRYAGRYGWPDRLVEVAATENGLLIKEEGSEAEAVPIDDRAFLVDPEDPDNPTVTFGSFDAAGRPGVLYLMLWGLPRLRE